MYVMNRVLIIITNVFVSLVVLLYVAKFFFNMYDVISTKEYSKGHRDGYDAGCRDARREKGFDG